MTDSPYIDQLADRVARIEGQLLAITKHQREVWQAIAELRDDLHTHAKRVDTVHRGALRALTDQLARRQHDRAPDQPR